MDTRIILLVLLLSAMPSVAGAEEIEELDEIEEVAPGRSGPDNGVNLDRAVAMMTGRTTRPGVLLFVIDHRNRKTFAKDTFRDFLGFDGGGLKIGLGLRYGILDGLDVGFYRVNGTVEVYDIYEFDLKYRPLTQAEHFVDLAVRGGLTWFYQPDQDDASGFFGQLLVSRTLLDRITLGAGLLYHSESSNDEKSASDEAWSVAAQALVEIRLLDWLAWNLEVAANLTGYGSDYPSFSTAIKFITHRHTFSVLVSNNQYASADGVLSNTWRGFGDLVLGFAITREFQF